MLSVGPFSSFSLPILHPRPRCHPLSSRCIATSATSIACHWSDCKPCNSRSAFFWPRHGASADFEMYTYPVQRKQIKDNQRLPREMDPDHAEGRWTANLRMTLQSWQHLGTIWHPSGASLVDAISQKNAPIRKLEGDFLSEKRSAGYDNDMTMI